VCDPAQAESVTECGSTWPKMAFVSHPRLVTTALWAAFGVCVARMRHAQPQSSATDKGTVVSDTRFNVSRGNGDETEISETRMEHLLWEITEISLKFPYVSGNLPSLPRQLAGARCSAASALPAPPHAAPCTAAAAPR